MKAAIRGWWNRKALEAPASRTEEPEGFIEGLCRATGWVLVERQHDRYWVRPGDWRPSQKIRIRYGGNFESVTFMSWLPIQFPMNPSPSGLFGRVLLRNLELRWAAWAMTMHESCEASLCVVARLPARVLNAALFHSVCCELVDEVHAFQQELYTKLRYEAPKASPTESTSVVVSDPGIRYLKG
jgi:hypothetical protein